MFSYKMFVICCLAPISMIMYKEHNVDDHYTAAVVEYKAIEYRPAHKMIMENLHNYEKIILNASNYGVDIIVFPESGLTGINIPQVRHLAREFCTEIPEPTDAIVPYLCTRYNSEILRKMSYAAKLHGVYVVINLPEIDYCNETDEDCPDDGAFYYNTNIVYDRNGAIVAKYRKYNLFCEWAFNRPKQHSVSTFTTDFGVTFSMLICFDILFEKPADQVSQLQNETHVIYNTAWMSQYPFLTAITTHSMWSYVSKMTMLASGYNNVSGALTGSGIYLSNGQIPVASITTPGNKILISKVPKISSSRKSSNWWSEYASHDNDDNGRIYLLPEISSHTVDENDRMKFYLTREMFRFHNRPLTNTRGKMIQTEFQYSNRDSFECRVRIWYQSNVTTNRNNDYKLIGYSCEQNLTVTSGYMEVCGLTLYPDNIGADDRIGLVSIPYGNDDHDGNGNGNNNRIITDDMVINSVHIFVRSSRHTYISIPVTLDNKFHPLNVNRFTYSTESLTNDIFTFEMRLLEPSSDLLTFAVYRLHADGSYS